MIVEKPAGLEITSTITGDAVKMGIDQSALVHIMGVLTDLYSDPEMAVLREYSTNAWDAHVEAGISDPIEVTLPAPLAPTLTIRDHGVGLTHDDIRYIYSQYGASTKRATNDQVGMLGLGCKSALTYAQQFTIVAVKDERKVMVAVSRDAEGAGTMTVVSDEPTSERCGVEIQIPARRNNTFDVKAKQLFSFWPEGSVLVNGEQPQRFEGYERLTDSLHFKRTGYYEHEDSFVVMGNVPYPVVPNDLGLASNEAVVAFVPIGAVDVPPAREKLHYTPKTQATLDRIKAELRAELQAKVQAEIDGAQSKPDAVRVASTVPSRFPDWAWRNAAFEFNGEPVPESYDQPVITTRAARGYALSSTTKYAKYLSQQWPGSVWITDFRREKITAPQKRKMLKWAEDNGVQVQMFVLVDQLDPTARPWIDPARIITWETITAIKLPTTAKPSIGQSRAPGSYKAHVSPAPAGMPSMVGVDISYARDTQAADIDTRKPVLYMGAAEYLRGDAFELLAARMPKGFTLVVLPQNRLAKFRRLFPKAQNIADWATKAYAAEAKTIGAPDWAESTIHNDYFLKLYLKSIDPQRVDDPALKEAARLARSKPAKNGPLEIYNAFNHAFYGTTARFDKPSGMWDNPLDNYPLLDHDVIRRDPDHVYHYLNSAYARRSI